MFVEPRYEHVRLVAEESCRVQLIDEPSLPFVWHRHPEHEVILVRSGTGRRFVAESFDHYAALDLVLLGPDIPHSWASHDAFAAERQRLTVIQFAPDFLGRDFFERPELRHVAALLRRSAGGLHFPLEETDPLLGRIGELEKSRGLPRLLYLLAVLDDLAGRDGSTPLSLGGWSRPGKGGRRVEAALQVLHERFADDLRLADVASAASLTPSAFSRFFRAVVGRTFTDYLNDLRIGAAQRLLVSSDLPIAAIAARVGFNSLANFNRRFRERAGCTPRAFREIEHQSTAT
jgi:AraC-like DNA-binding protein